MLLVALPPSQPLAQAHAVPLQYHKRGSSVVSHPSKIRYFEFVIPAARSKPSNNVQIINLLVKSFGDNHLGDMEYLGWKKTHRRLRVKYEKGWTRFRHIQFSVPQLECACWATALALWFVWSLVVLDTAVEHCSCRTCTGCLRYQWWLGRKALHISPRHPRWGEGIFTGKT